MVLKTGYMSVLPTEVSNMRENLSLNKEDELVPDILNLMCL